MKIFSNMLLMNDDNTVHELSIILLKARYIIKKEI